MSIKGYNFDGDDFHIIMNKSDSCLMSLIQEKMTDEQITKSSLSIVACYCIYAR